MKNVLKTICWISCLFFLFTGLSFASNGEEYKYHRAIIDEILSVEEMEIEGIDETQVFVSLKARLLGSNEFVEIDVVGLKNFRGTDYEQGDRVLVSEFTSHLGESSFSIVSYDRQNVLITLFLIFLGVALIISSKRTIGAVLGLVFSFFIIFAFLIPKILEGYNPVFISILSATIMIPVNFYLSHGFNKKTTIAIFSTIIALIITGVLALLFMNWAHITGYGLEDMMLISTMIDSNINLEGLLLAGVIIGTLGVLDDITISQVAIVQQISEVGSKLEVGEIFSRAMSIGKDHMASMINTLVLVYTGAAMPLLILFVNANLPLNYILSMEIVSMEVLRTLVGSIGLVCAIPITTFLATIVFTRNSKP